ATSQSLFLVSPKRLETSLAPSASILLPILRFLTSLPNYKFHWCPEGRPCTLLTRISGRVRFPLLLLRTPAQLSLEKLSTSAKNSLIAPWDGFVEGVSVKQGAEAACAYSTLGSSSVGFLSL